MDTKYIETNHIHILRESHNYLDHRGYYPTRCIIANHWPLTMTLCGTSRLVINARFTPLPRLSFPPQSPFPLAFVKKPLSTRYTCWQLMDTLTLFKRDAPYPTGLSLKCWGKRLGTHWVNLSLRKFFVDGGRIEEIVTNNETPFVGALNWLTLKYHIWHICMSAHNSQAHSIIEHLHCTIHNSLVKACNSVLVGSGQGSARGARASRHLGISTQVHVVASFTLFYSWIPSAWSESLLLSVSVCITPTKTSPIGPP